MRQRIPTFPRAVTLALVACAVASGCSSNPKGPGRTAKAVESLNDTRKQLANASKQVNDTNQSLRTLADASSGDLRSLYNKFAENVRDTEEAAKKARERSEAMRKNTDAYVAEWQKEFGTISDEQLRRMSQERASAARADFERVRSAAAEARAAYEPYMQGLKDVQQYLANDLTADGVRSIRPKADDTIRKGDTLQQRIAAVQAEVEALSGKWSSKLGG
jgi:chromosome segregation ATPase